jgi:hypothetical protein
MKLLIAIFLLIPTLALAQVKQWTDEKGVTHFEAQGTGREPSPTNQQNSTDEPGKSKAKIDRSPAGLTLKEPDSSFRSSKNWTPSQPDKFGGQGFIGLPSGDISELKIFFVDQRLVQIHITYKESNVNYWERMIKTTADKYGAPITNGYSEAKWFDDQTLLNLKKNFKGGIEVILTDRELSDRYYSRTGQAAPKF